MPYSKWPIIGIGEGKCVVGLCVIKALDPVVLFVGNDYAARFGSVLKRHGYRGLQVTPETAERDLEPDALLGPREL